MANQGGETHTPAELRDGVRKKTAQHHVFRIERHLLRIQLDFDPEDPETYDDKIILLGGDDPDKPVYEQTKTIEDDAEKGDDVLDLVYTGLDPALSYWLRVDPGAEGDPYFVFENIAYDDLDNTSEES